MDEAWGPIGALAGLFALARFLLWRGVYAAGAHARLAAKSHDVEGTRRLRVFVRWFLAGGVVVWLVALAVFRARLEVAVLGGLPLLWAGAGLGLRLLARQGRISLWVYVLARVLLPPLIFLPFVAFAVGRG
ncbi:MAG: hypothetical protein ACRDJ4_12900 [Actinomycetota bacterium]